MSCRYEGPRCDIDINECVRGTSACAPQAGCINSMGGYSCICPWGYAGAALEAKPLPSPFFPGLLHVRLSACQGCIWTSVAYCESSGALATLWCAQPVRGNQLKIITPPSPCSQLWAHAGDGYTSCSPGLQLAELSGSYESEGPSRVACNEGANVIYPAGAPGFAYDPIDDTNAPGSPRAVRPALLPKTAIMGTSTVSACHCSHDGLLARVT